MQHQRLAENPLLLKDPVYEHAGDVLEQMKRLESTIYRRPNTRPRYPFNSLWRQQIIEWMYILVKYCKLQHEAAAAGAYFLDVAVAKGIIKSAGDYQLGALACLYLGLKMFDSPGLRIVKAGSLAKLGNSNLTEQDIIRMEMLIVKAMGWHVTPPTPNCFLQQYLLLLPIQNERTKNLIETRALNVIETAIARESFYSVKPSLIGLSAVLIGIDQLLLDEQKKSTGLLPPLPTYPISLWQLRTFLYNIHIFANIDHTSTAVHHTVTVLTQIMKKTTPPHHSSKSTTTTTTPAATTTTTTTTTTIPVPVSPTSSDLTDVRPMDTDGTKNFESNHHRHTSPTNHESPNNVMLEQ